MGRRGIVLGRHAGRYRVHSGGEIVDASLRGRLKQGPSPKEGSSTEVLVGDEVDVARHPDGSWTIERCLPRRSVLQRRTPGRAHGVRAVAANVDQVVVVGAACDPVWDPGLMDRFLAVAEANDLPPVLVVNKCDLVGDAQAIVAPYRGPGYLTIQTSLPDGRGLDALRQTLAGHTSLFTGPTGVGKSSLLNALEPGLDLRTQPVSTRSRTGRHTTVAATMFPLRSGGFVVDTPGLRDIGLWGLTPQEVSAAFPELAPFAGQCRFDNCRHLEEPSCAVNAAAERGELAKSRLDSYRALLAEALMAARPWAARRRSGPAGDA